MAKVWDIAPIHSEDLIDQLLFNRGVKTADEKKKFFDPKVDDYKDELELKGISAAKKRILQAIDKKEQIFIYGDYDVDGVSGTAILYHGLTSIGAKVLPYIPHREKEGYGLSSEGLQKVKDQGAGLVITVDNGIVAVEQVLFAKTLGLDLIITDHHLPQEKLPEAVAIVHSTEMSGGAVAWCLMRQLISPEQAEELLDLVALSTIGDMLPLVGLNRALVTEGLIVFNKTKRVGLLALISVVGLSPGRITALQIGQVIGPKINAIGRLDHSIEALRLLCTKDIHKARLLAELFVETNNQQMKLTTQAVAEAKEYLLQDADVSDKKIVFLYSDKWTTGIISLVAWRICEEYRLPTIIVSQGEAFSKGSARSANGLDIVEIIRNHSDILTAVGGHAKAAGFTVATQHLALLKERLEKSAAGFVIDQTEKVKIEALVEGKKLTRKTVEEINLLEPFGIGNPRPVLGTRNMKLSNIKAVGEGKHLKFKADGIDAIAFSMGNLTGILQDGQLADIAFNLEIDCYNGNEKLQLKVADIKLA
ncbi:MAG: single-stranded-DNA-specific exonuclease RecJ [Armatimonadetes bacterium]|nr:MAG: single-stranded-DNA-specific exonuclease RecJ [Armatimonadota bacterium]